MTSVRGDEQQATTGPTSRLSRDRILDVAVALARAEGPAALSMRRIAAELGTGAMSLYNHVPDKAALLDGVAERVLEPVVVPDGPDWRAVAAGWASSLRDALLANRGMGPVVVSPPGNRALLRVSQRVLDRLTGVGLDRADALRVVRVVGRLVAGSVMFDTASLLRPTPPPRAELDETFDLALAALLDGLAPRLDS